MNNTDTNRIFRNRCEKYNGAEVSMDRDRSKEGEQFGYRYRGRLVGRTRKGFCGSRSV